MNMHHLLYLHLLVLVLNINTYFVLVGPVVIQHPVNFNVITSSNATLQCTVSGIPPPTVTWQYNSTLAMEGSGDNLMGNVTATSYGIIQSVLTLQYVTLSDTGSYKCVATTSGYPPVISDIANLNVIGKKS